MPCHAILIPSFLPAAATIYRSPKRHAAARQRRHQTTPNAGGGGGKKNTWTELHPLHACVAPWHVPAAKKKKKGHRMTLGDRHSRKDGRNEKIRHVQKGRQAYIQVGQQPTPPLPPPVSCGIRACLVCNCTSPLARSSRPPHTQISGDSTAPSAPVDHPRTFVPGPCSGPGSMGMGWPKRERFETSIPLEQEGRTETRA